MRLPSQLSRFKNYIMTGLAELTLHPDTPVIIDKYNSGQFTMTTVAFPNQSTSAQPDAIIYPSSDGEPVAETSDHLYAILTTLEVLKQHLENRKATVLANQNLFYI